MTVGFIVFILNGAACAITCLSILMYRRKGARFRLGASAVAYVLALATGAVAIRTLYGTYGDPVDPSELLINGVLCVSMLASRGNVTVLISPRKMFGEAKFWT